MPVVIFSGIPRFWKKLLFSDSLNYMPVVIFSGIPRFWKKLLFSDSLLANAHPPDNLRKMFTAKAGFKVKKDFPAMMPLTSGIHS